MTLFNTKSLLAATLLTTAAAVSFAQAPAAPKATVATTPAVVTAAPAAAAAPAKAASTPKKHAKHHKAKTTDAAAPAVTK